MDAAASGLTGSDQPRDIVNGVESVMDFLGDWLSMVGNEPGQEPLSQSGALGLLLIVGMCGQELRRAGEALKNRAA
ncbi:MAG: hypothetical protein HQK81_06225 [Desulfovibrionaceae bacterium]|nr:hypothetical protein [Desulfovibrionaceae bacterium]MBF0513646.1 hypothetical protein [Desulfovibrionaceae bacterium]